MKRALYSVRGSEKQTQIETGTRPAAAIHECCDVRRNRALETVTGSRTGSYNQSGGVRSSGSFFFI